VAPKESVAPEEPAEVPKAPPVPTECTQQGDLCLVPREFAERLCAGKYQDLALYLFGKGQPWSRGYIRVEELDALNTYGGPVSGHLTYGEEVLIVGRRGGRGSKGVQVSGGGGYQVLRWDGTCATLADHEIVKYQPRTPGGAPITWKYLAEATRESLLADEGIVKARESHREKCHGVRFGHDRACDRASERLDDRIRVAVRSGLQVPVPERLP
jgi:hypothetical protein